MLYKFIVFNSEVLPAFLIICGPCLQQPDKDPEIAKDGRTIDVNSKKSYRNHNESIDEIVLDPAFWISDFHN